jgi:hypothetical protein
VANPDGAAQRLRRQPRFQIAQLAFRAQPRELPILERGYAGGVIATIFKQFEGADERARNRLASENPYNPAHALFVLT